MTSRYTVLIVDPSPGDRVSFRNFLTSENLDSYQIIEAETATEALALYDRFAPDCVLIDFVLPDRTGLEVLAIWQADSGRQPLPVVMITGQGDETVAVQAMKLGAHDYLVKGNVTAKGLDAAVRSCIEQACLRQQAEQQHQQQRLVDAIALLLFQSLDLDTILASATRKIRTFLKADRVLVYQFAADGSGTVVAESVVFGWSPCLKMRIRDTHLQSSETLACRTQSRAIADIHAAGLSPCHTDMLGLFQVRAYLIAPIFIRPSLTESSASGKLAPEQAVAAAPQAQPWGLLIAHQCDGPRDWQQTEQDLLEQLALHLAIAIHQAELYQTLQLSNQRLELALAAGQSGTWEWNILTNRVIWSPQCEKLFGFPPGCFAGTHEAFLQQVHPEDVAPLERSLKVAMQTADNWEWDYRILLPDGSLRWINSTGKFIYTTTGPIVRMMGITKDITARKLAETELQQAKANLEVRVAKRTAKLSAVVERLQQELTERKRLEVHLQETSHTLELIIQSSPLAIVVLDLQTCITVWNPAAVALFGWQPAEVLGKPLCSFSKPQIASFEQSFSSVMAGETFANHETQQQRKDGSLVDIILSTAPLRNASGAVIGSIGIITDISDRKQAEQSLKASEAQNRALIQALPDTLIRVRADGTYLDFINSGNIHVCNPHQIFGGTTIYNVMPPALAAERMEIIQRALQTNTLQIYEYAITVDDQVYVEEARIVPCAQDEVLIVIRDITERKHIEAALRQSEANNRAMLAAIPDLLLRVAADGTCLDFIPPTAAQSGAFLPINHHLSEVLPPDLLHHQLMCMARARATGELQVWEHQLLKNGRLSQEEVRLVPCSDSEFLIIVRDVTAIKQAQNALQLSEERLQLALEVSGDGLWDWNFETNVVYMSPRWFEMLGYEADELPMVVGTWEQLVHPDDLVWVQDLLAAHLQDSSVPYAFDYRLRTKSGEWKWIADYGKVVARDRQGKPLRMIGTHKDMSDRKQAELELQRAKEAAEIANKAKSIFLANMSHELRTPLNIILGFAQIMDRDRTLAPDQQENIRTIQRSGEHLLHLINEILDLSKIEAGQVTLQESAVHLPELLHSLRDMFRQKAQVKGLQLNLELDAGLPPYIKIDPNKLRQVLINLLGNAIKFTDVGHVTLRVTNRTPATGREARPDLDLTSCLLRFDVEDTGIGIAPEEQSLIFNAFVQTQVGKTSVDGTGLGLTISRKFVQVMGGEMGLSSVPGQGSTFWVMLPVPLASACEAGMVQPPRRVVGLVAGQPQYRVLVVDDQPENRRLLVMFLARVGLDVREATDGQEAVQVWKQWQPHLIWMDIRMPRLDGWAATQQIRLEEARRRGQALLTPGTSRLEEETRPSTVIVALTAQAANSDRQRMLEAGCNDFLGKPFQEEDLFAVMEQHLGVRFIYAEADRPSAIAPTIQPTARHKASGLTAEKLSVMPTHWIAAIYQAARQCDDEELLDLIQAIPQEYSELIMSLRRLAQNFEFQIIMELAQNLI